MDDQIAPAESKVSAQLIQPPNEPEKSPIKPKQAFKKWVLIFLVILIVLSLPIEGYTLLGKMGIRPNPSKITIARQATTPSLNKPKIVKYFILSNLKVCNILDRCLNLTLDEREINNIKSEAKDFEATIKEWVGDKLQIHVEPVVISKQINTDFTYFTFPAKGWALERQNVADIIRSNVDRNTDFVLLTTPINEKSTGFQVTEPACGYSYGAGDSNSIGGTGYSWIPSGCAGKKAMIHEWLHQLIFSLRDFNGLVDIYNGNYPQTLCGKTNPKDNFKWFPNIDVADKVPDFDACKKFYNHWREFCNSILPQDCDYNFDKSVLQKHFPGNIDYIGNYCRDGIKDYTETAVDKGPECGDVANTPAPTSSPTPTTVATSRAPTCRPRPACLDASPRCMMAETSDMCPPRVTPSP